MNNIFLNKVKDIQNTENINNVAYEEIITNLLIKNKKSNNKSTDLDSYNSEELMPSVLLPGNIYIMSYNAKTESEYLLPNGKILHFSDKEPIVLITSVNGNKIRGINLNLCTLQLRTQIINFIYEIDTNFFEQEIYKLISEKKMPISQKILKFFTGNNGEKYISNFLKQFFNKYAINSIFRTYNIENIKNIRLIEPYQWKYLSYLNYYGNIKKEMLDMIHTIINSKD